MQVSVIIVNYNVKYYVEQCLHAVFAALNAGVDGEVFVVDNASSDGSVDFLRQRFPQEQYPNFHLIANAQNRGFGQANNQAAQQASGRYILYLNPDTIITEHTLTDCIAFADKHPELGALGVKMLGDDGRFALESRRGIPTPWRAFCKMSGLTRIFPHSHTLGGYYYTYESPALAQEIEIVSGAFMWVQRHLPTILFDEQFFMYGEDIDLSYRLLQAGKKNYYLPSPIVHYKGESTHSSTYRYVHVFYQAILIFYQKHFGSSLWWLGVPIKVAIIVQALCSLLRLYARQFQRFLFPKNPLAKERFIYTGQHVATIHALSTQWGISIDCRPLSQLSELASILPEPSKTTHLRLIFDFDTFSRSEVLEALEAQASNYYLATFYPDTQTLITGSRVYVGT